MILIGILMMVYSYSYPDGHPNSDFEGYFGSDSDSMVALMGTLICFHASFNSVALALDI